MTDPTTPMILALLASVALGLAIGARYRVPIALIASAASAAAVGALAIGLGGSALDAACWGLLALIIVQDSYLAGAALRILRPSDVVSRRLAALLARLRS